MASVPADQNHPQFIEPIPPSDVVRGRNEGDLQKSRFWSVAPTGRRGGVVTQQRYQMICHVAQNSKFIQHCRAARYLPPPPAPGPLASFYWTCRKFPLKNAQWKSVGKQAMWHRTLCSHERQDSREVIDRRITTDTLHAPRTVPPRVVELSHPKWRDTYC